MKFKLSEEEHTKLVELFQTARDTPTIVTDVQSHPAARRSWADDAWDKVRQFQKELGVKYGYDWETAVIPVGRQEFEAEGL